MWTALFAATNLIALAAWTILVVLPRRPAAMAAVLYLGVGLLSLGYAVLLALLLTGVVAGGVDPTGLDEFSLKAMRSAFASDAAMVLGWMHYLAFDLFVGLWIARDADAKRFSRLAQAPVLLATFLFGPLGLFTWLAIRERRARAMGRWK
ncbi:ABA4-like family protein [Pelagerythrobacter marensis]|uniref:ABA4-like family protein n=1 Tax=Pelagerythrobacter marensis TaxID=543877 RepID=A0ABZ2D033_9SPHN